jgi:hypothetical protein
MNRVISCLFDDYASARNAVAALQEAGFTSNEVSLVASNADSRHVEDDAGSGAVAGTGVGGAVGAGAGILTSLGVIAIPGLGPLVAAGILATTLATTVAGAVAGGLIGSLMDYGISEEEAHLYAEGIRRGGTLVTVRSTPERVAQAEAILDRFESVDVNARRDYYAQSGWSGFDPNAPAYSASDIKRERSSF